ncbi:MAG: hypothetical protein CL947_00245 [Epsilonproteobacteria bacterium]|nr:hypothetical protein [Campylobacterota bacterium]
MSSYFHIAQPWHMLYAALFLLTVLFYRYTWYQPTLYIYPLTTFLKKQKLQASSFYTQFFYLIRLASLVCMVLLIGKPQFVDPKSKINVEGIDIILTLDVSKSMECFDDVHDRRSRWEVAKTEALHFIDKRDNDAIGLVIFGRYAIARCPLTTDKQVLKDIIAHLEIGMPSADMSQGTMLSQSIVTASRRLQKSQAKSKVIVLLTDGTPTPGDLSPKEAIEIAQKLNIKIYTIGIGGDHGGLVQDPVFGIQSVGAPLNKQLLHTIAQQTGGTFFEAKKPKDLKTIYDKIDQLEKVSYETEIYNRYFDYFLPILWLIIILLLSELCLATFVWFIV